MKRLSLLTLFLLSGGCAVRAGPISAPMHALAATSEVADPSAAIAPVALEAAQAPVVATVSEASPEVIASEATALPQADASGDPEDGEDSEAPVEEEAESEVPSESTDPNAVRFTVELTDEELAGKWKTEPEALGSVSFGFAHEGRLMNAVRVPSGPGWVVVSPDRAWATQETVAYIIAAATEVHRQFPEAPPLRVNQLSKRDGGYLRPHKSHQNGRDVDFGFYYPGPNPIIVREREKVIDPALNWALVKALVTLTDVQVILVDRRVQKVLYDYALSAGEDRAWLDAIFNSGIASIVQHARRHRDHFHVRFFNPRAQELGRRVTPLLAQRPEQNVVMHRVRSGDTLGHIAARYNSSVAAIQKANGMRGSFLRLAQVLKVPLRGPCTRCPLPPPVQIRPRLLPPVKTQARAPARQTPPDLAVETTVATVASAVERAAPSDETAEGLGPASPSPQSATAAP